ncbi:MAG: EcsC family protein [Acidimicrobiales bacterium]
MSRTKRYFQRRAVERIPTPALNAVGKAVLQAVDKAVEERWDRAVRIAAEAEGDTAEARVRSISKRFRRELGAVGAATGAVAAAPGLGTGAATATLVADLGWFAMRSTDLIMAIGAAHGYTASSPDQRRAWVLSVLAFGEEAASQFTSLLSEIDAGAIVGGERISARLAGLAGGDVATLDALRRINTSLAATVIAKYGSRRSLLAVGKLLPFGVGAVVGGSANYALIRVVGSQAGKFFAGYGALLPPPPAPGQYQLPRPSGPSIPASATMNGAGSPPNGQAEPSSGGHEPSIPGAGSIDGPPPPAPGSRRLPNPLARLSKHDRRSAIPTDGHKK